MAKQRKTLYYSYSPVTQELMVTTVDPKNLGKVENVMLDSDHYLQVDPKTKKRKDFLCFLSIQKVKRKRFTRFQILLTFKCLE